MLNNMPVSLIEQLFRHDSIDQLKTVDFISVGQQEYEQQASGYAQNVQYQAMQ